MKFFEPLETGFTIYSKSNCSYCTKVKRLLLDNHIFFTDIECDDFLTKDKEIFLLFIKNKANKEYKTFPMVFNDGKFIGGFTETQDYVNKFLCFTNEDF
jgi:glutaredoxin